MTATMHTMADAAARCAAAASLPADQAACDAAIAAIETGLVEAGVIEGPKVSTAYMAIQCTASTGEVGSYLHSGSDPATGDLVSPVFADTLDAWAWADANGWTRGEQRSAHPCGVFYRLADFTAWNMYAAARDALAKGEADDDSIEHIDACNMLFASLSYALPAVINSEFFDRNWQATQNERVHAAIVEIVAHSFSHGIKANLTADEFAAMQLANAVETSPLVCHSHDYIDSNMTMLETFTDFGITAPTDCADGSPEYVAACALWNDAWNVAKARHFATV
jgi:hypothetical protein